MQIDVTMTACRRPELLVKTLESFRRNLGGIRFWDQTLHINVDPVPADRISSSMEVSAQCYFQTIRMHTPDTPSFPVAVKWCWLQPTSEFFLHLEDDWELREPFDIQTALDAFAADPTLSCVNLRAYGFPEGDRRICLSPGIHRASHARQMARRMTLDANPEKQLRPVAPDNPKGGRHHGFYSRQMPEHTVLRDIGRVWLGQSGWKKSIPVHFTCWEKQ